LLDAFVLSGCGQAKSGLPCRIPTKTLPAEAVLFSEAPLTDRGCGAKRFPFQWPPRDCCAVRAPSSTPFFKNKASNFVGRLCYVGEIADQPMTCLRIMAGPTPSFAGRKT
jgi:hypothetical protein